MKTITTIFILLLSCSLYGQINILADAGISFNTSDNKKSYGEFAKNEISPTFELGITYTIKKRFVVGLVGRYDNLSIKFKQYIPNNAGGYYVGSEETNKPFKQIIAPMIILGTQINVNKFYFIPYGELGLALIKKGISNKGPSVAVGIRFDAVYRLTKILGIHICTGATFYNIKHYEGWSIPIKAGVRISI